MVYRIYWYLVSLTNLISGPTILFFRKQSFYLWSFLSRFSAKLFVNRFSYLILLCFSPFSFFSSKELFIFSVSALLELRLSNIRSQQVYDFSFPYRYVKGLNFGLPSILCIENPLQHIIIHFSLDNLTKRNFVKNCIFGR